MENILQNQVLKSENLLSFRSKISQMELNKVVMKMKSFAESQNARLKGNPITATFGLDGDKMDIELLIPLDREIKIDNTQYQFKKRFELINALMIRHIGNPNLLQNTCDRLNKYIVDNKLTPITVGYNVTVKASANDIDNTEIDIYVGISPNIL